MNNFTVRGRIAPSPTGRMHLGNAFALLMAFCSAKSKGGSLVLRIEDIDPDRSQSEFERGIVEDLAWLGIHYDEGPDKGGDYAPYRQSERQGYYRAALARLKEKGLVYPCFCTRKELKLLASAPHNEDGSTPYPGTCRKLTDVEQRRLKSSGKTPCLRLDVAQSMATGYSGTFVSGGDFALMRSDGVFAYQLAVVVDDIAMGISEVVRGHDLLESTARQTLLYHLFLQTPPFYMHVPLLCDEHGERLAKRHRSMTLASLREQGVKPESIIGYLGHIAGLAASATPMTPLELSLRFDAQKVSGDKILLPPDPFNTLAKNR